MRRGLTENPDVTRRGKICCSTAAPVSKAIRSSARRSRSTRFSTHLRHHRTNKARAIAARPRPSWPPPKHKPITVTNHNVAAVVTPCTRSLRRTIAPAPMNPIPDKIPSGKRIRSSVTNEPADLPAIGSSRLTWIMLIAAASATSIVVRKPTGRLCSPRLRPIAALAIAVSAKRSAIEDHSIWAGISALPWLPSAALQHRPAKPQRGINQS